MNLLNIIVLAQVAVSRPAPPVLAFPEAGLDDTASYQGYQTRFYRDAAGNTVQIYVDGRSGRVVHLWADSENASAGFTARDANSGRPASLRWLGQNADVSRSGRTRTLTHRLEADASQIALGWFLLGTMRVERDFQYWGKHREPFANPPFVLQELQDLAKALDRLHAAERHMHLGFVRARDLETLRSRFLPTVTTRTAGTEWIARIVQPSLDARDTMTLVVRADNRLVSAARAGDSLTLSARTGSRVPFTVSITTTARPLTPLTRAEIFNRDFLAFLENTRRTAATSRSDSVRLRARLLERQVRGVELLSSREKLMAGLPAYATYFGRDMQVSALMMQPIWRDEMSAFVVASVLRKLSPTGQVSHEEALGGQAVREAASEYASLIDQYARAVSAGRRNADTLLARARVVLRDHRRVRENYHMIDDEFQLPILLARWIGDPNLTKERTRAFLLDSSDGGGPRYKRLIRELDLVANMTAPYVADPRPTNLVPFAPRDTGWSSASWRDSGVGYAGGKFAMDVNAIWAPHALTSMAPILEALRSIGVSADRIVSELGQTGPDRPLVRYARDPEALQRAVEVWWGASQHFVVRLGPDEIRARVAARVDALPPAERAYWSQLPTQASAERDSLSFLALSLDAQGRPIGVANTDPATGLFLGALANQPPAEEALRDVRLFVRPYPVGLFIEGVGPVVANDAYATPPVWAAFERDRYHGPRVVWGREVNLFVAGAALRVRSKPDAQEANELRAAIAKVSAAADASGFQSELWSYELQGGRMVPVRYGTGSDVQLWSTTDLAVQFLLSRLR